MKDKDQIKENISTKNNRIVFSSVENQWDVQLANSLTLTPIENLKMMKQLNEQAFGIKEEILEKPKRIIWGSYEYIPS